MSGLVVTGISPGMGRRLGQQARDWVPALVVFVTHSIPEAVFLSTRVVVMSPRPGRIAGVVDIDLPHPRTVETREEPRFFELVTEVRELLRKRGEHLQPEEEEALQ